MPTFTYKARNNAGKLINGKLDAESAQIAAQTLQNRGQTPITIQAFKESSDMMEKLAYWQAMQKININDLILFSRQMHSLIKAGVPMIRAINSLAESNRNIALKQTFLSISQKLEAGQPLSQAMSQHSKIFPLLLISIVNIGETTGSLEKAFYQIGQYLNRDKETQNRVKSALRYPTMVIAAITIAMAIVNIYVIPSFKGVFDKIGAELPWQTKMLMTVSDFSVHYWPHMIAGIFALFLVFRKYISTAEGVKQWHWLLLKMPVVGSIIEGSIMERFCRSFGMILDAGVPLIQGIAIVSKSVGNEYISNRLLQMRIGIEKGDSISRMARTINLFPGLVLQMLVVGEESGNISEMLLEAADFYEGEIDTELRNLSSVIEPILIVIIGIMVLLLALGIFLPMWNLSSAMQH
jgi:MSHA biogenesis protein MshG